MRVLSIWTLATWRLSTYIVFHFGKHSPCAIFSTLPAICRANRLIETPVFSLCLCTPGVPVLITLQVAKFHRKVVRRLATEKRAADTCAGDGRADNTQLGSIESFSGPGAMLASSGPTLGEEQGALWEHALHCDEV